MIISLSNAFLVNLYWLLFLIPGFGGYLLLKKLSDKTSTDYFALKLVYSFFFSCILLSPIAVFAYFFKIGPAVSTIYFVILTLLGLLSIIKFSELPKSLLKPKDLWSKIRGYRPDFWTILVIILLVFDFVFSGAVKGYIHFGFDAWVHMAKINMDVFQGFSKFDPYFIDGTKGIIQSNYPSNIVHVILAFPGKLFNVNTLWTWAYSVSFFRYIALAIVYVFARQMTKNKDLAIFATILYYFGQVFSLGFMIPMYPTFVAFLVSIFLLQIVFDLEEKTVFSAKINYALYITTIILLSLTHQVISNIFTLFLGGLFVILWILKRINFRKLLLLAAPLVLGLPTAIFTLVNSRYIPKSVVDINNSLYYLTDKIYVLKYSVTSISLGFVVLLVGLYFSHKYIQGEHRLTVLYYALTFNIVLLYTPVFMIVHKFLPTWAIVRYDYFNAFFTLFLTALGLWSFISFLQKRTSGSDSNLSSRFYILTILLMLAIFNQTAIKDAYGLSSSNQSTFKKMLDLSSLKNNLIPESVVMADADVSFSLPALSSVYVAGLDDTRTTDSVDTKQRETDMNNFFKKDFANQDKLTILKRYNVSYVILSDAERDRVSVSELGLTEIYHSTYYYLYQVKQ